MADTLIVWTEPDGVDYALSFQDPEGCSEVWNFIQDVQKHFANGMSLSSLLERSLTHAIQGLSSSPITGPAAEPSALAANIARGGGLPKPTLSTIADIEKAMKTIVRVPSIKERICEFIQNDVSRLLLSCTAI